VECITWCILGYINEQNKISDLASFLVSLLFDCAGNLLGLLLSSLLLSTFGWRALFIAFGALGLPLLAFWNAVVPDKPDPPSAPLSAMAGTPPSTLPARRDVAQDTAQPGALDQPVRAAEASSASVPRGAGIKELLSSSATWAIVIVNIVNHWGYFIYLNWMPTYFVKVRHWFPLP
jgi:ACS family sodium-dependent inorganic phosphate cotransporter/ACS family sodium-dependent inorganic phosphate cotransporter-like MFS transporter 9